MAAKPNPVLFIAALAGASAVVLGAFGAHALEEVLTPDRAAIWETASHYHLAHAVVLLALALAPEERLESRWRTRAAAAFALGIVVFAGSLYALALTGIGMLGAITPIGGSAMIAGWVMLAMATRTSERRRTRGDRGNGVRGSK